jgi:hypothetical protein
MRAAGNWTEDFYVAVPAGEGFVQTVHVFVGDSGSPEAFEPVGYPMAEEAYSQGLDRTRPN